MIRRIHDENTRALPRRLCGCDADAPGSIGGTARVEVTDRKEPSDMIEPDGDRLEGVGCFVEPVDEIGRVLSSEMR